MIARVPSPRQSRIVQTNMMFRRDSFIESFPLQPLSAAVLCFVLLSFSGCGGPFEDNYDPRDLTTGVDCFAVAPIVLVGTITGVQQTGRTRPTRKGGEYLLDPVQISVNVQHVLKGHVDLRTIQVFGFRYNTRTGHEPEGGGFIPRIGDYRMFLLKEERGRLRIVGDDVHGSDTPIIYTGDHRTIDASILNDPGKAISWVLLTPGDGARINTGFFELYRNAAIALAVTHDKEWVLSLLNRLTTYPDRDIQTRARRAIDLLTSNKWPYNEASACPVSVQ